MDSSIRSPLQPPQTARQSDRREARSPYKVGYELRSKGDRVRAFLPRPVTVGEDECNEYSAAQF